MATEYTARASTSEANAAPLQPTVVQDAFNSTDPTVVNRAITWAKEERKKLWDQSSQPTSQPAVTNPRVSHAEALNQLNGTLQALYGRLAAASTQGGFVPYDPNGTVSRYFRPDGTFTAQDATALAALSQKNELDNYLRAVRMVANYAREMTYLQSQNSAAKIEDLKRPTSERAYSTLINVIARASGRLAESEETGEAPSQIQLDRQILNDAKKASSYDLYYDGLVDHLRKAGALVVVDITPRKKGGKVGVDELKAELEELRKKPITPENIKAIADMTRQIRERSK